MAAPRFDDLVRDGAQVEEAPEWWEAAGRAINRAGTVGLAPRINALAESTFPRLQLREGFLDPDVPTPAPVTYDEALARNRELQDVTAEQHPVIDTVTQIGVSALHPLNKLGGAGFRGAVLGGGAQGAIQGGIESRADLTKGDAEEYARAFADTVRGAEYGAAGGAAGHAVGAGVRAVGRRAGSALARARGDIADDILEGRAAEEQALVDKDLAAQEKIDAADGRAREMNKAVDARAAREEARRVAMEAREARRAAREQERAGQRLGREQGQALEMDKQRAARMEREAARAADREAQAAVRRARTPQPGEPLEPDTKVLEGMRGKAGERRAVNYDRVAEYRRAMEDPALSPAGKERLRVYAEQYGDAVDNPAAFERRMVERYLRQRYSPEVAERVLRERVGPNAEILPRPAAPAAPPPATPLLPSETPTLGGDWEDFARVQGENPAMVRAELYGPGAKNMGARGRGEDTEVQWNRDTAQQQDVDFDEAPTVRDASVRERLPPVNPNARRTAGIYEVDLDELRDVPAHAYRKETLRQAGEAFDAGNPDVVPPIRINESDGRRELGDGNNRLAAARKSNAPRIWAEFGSDAAAEARPGRPRGRSSFRDATSPADDPFHDAKTKVGLIETTEDLQPLRDELEAADYRGNTDVFEQLAEELEDLEGLRKFRFRDPKSGRDFEIEAVENVDGDVWIESVHPADMSMNVSHQKAWAKEANKVGPRIIMQVLPDLARAFPDAQMIGGKRVTGIHTRRARTEADLNAWVRLPEVTAQVDPRRMRAYLERRNPTPVVEPPTGNEVTVRADISDRVRRGELPPAFLGGSGSAFEAWPHDARTVMDVPETLDLPPLEEVTAPGAPRFPPEAPQRFDALSGMPARRPGADGLQGFQAPTPPPMARGTVNQRGTPPALAQALEMTRAEGSMAAPVDYPTNVGEQPTVTAPQLQIRRPAPRPMAAQAPPLPAPTPQAAPAPASPPDVTRFAPPSVQQRLGPLDLQGEVDARVARGGGAIQDAFARGVSGPQGLGFGLAGLVLDGLSGGVKGVLLRGGAEAAKEIATNPAAKARVITALRLQLLAQQKPEVYARVANTLTRAMERDAEQGTDAHFRSARHVLLQRDADFRTADAEIGAQLTSAEPEVLARQAQALAGG